MPRSNWVRSSFCTDNACVEVDVWKKSTLSVDNGNCVEVSGDEVDQILVRHSKDPQGPILAFTADEWNAFIGGAKRGEFDLKG